MKTDMEIVELCTFPDDDSQYCKCFTVPKDWLMDILEILDGMNECKGVDLENFLDNYCWEETWCIYCSAKQVGCVLSERIEL